MLSCIRIVHAGFSNKIVTPVAIGEHVCQIVDCLQLACANAKPPRLCIDLEL